jgi:hypothetical protein
MQGLSPEAFLYVPTGHGAQLKVSIANACPTLQLLRTSDAVNPWDTTEPSVRKRTSTMDVEEVMAKGTSLPSGGNLQNMIGVAGMCATICLRIQRIQT